ncbi:MAG: NfeD family protein [Candidatus Rhabdochlamydia sp.]
MIVLTAILAFVGLALIFMEFFFPSGFLIFSAAIFLLTTIFSFSSLGFGLGFTLLYMILLLMAIIATIAAALSRIRSKMVLHEDQYGFYSHQLNPLLLGKRGVVLSDLKPLGYIEIEGHQYLATVEMGYVAKDTWVHVIELRGSTVIVKLLHQEVI